MFNFEWFDKSVGIPTVSIGSYGITLNTAVLNLFPRTTTHIRLGFDKERGVIGIQPLDTQDSGAFEVNLSPEKGWVRIYSKDFVRYVEANNQNVDLTKTEKYLVEWDDEFKVLILDLKKKVKYGNSKNDEIEDGEEPTDD